MRLRFSNSAVLFAFLFLFLVAHQIPAIAQSGPSISTITDNSSGAAITSGAIGQLVNINGGGFGSTQGSSTATFNGTAATIYGWNSNVIYVGIPTAATTGNLLVTVGGVASNAVSFTILAGPDITLVNDNSSGATISSGGIGQLVNIHGGGFGSTQGSSTVTFNGTAATIYGWNPFVIYVGIPTGAMTGNLVVTVGGVASNAVSFTILPGPNVTSVNDNSSGASIGSGAIGQRVDLHGGGFGSTQGSSTVTFNGTAATIDSWYQNVIHVFIPTGATTGNLVVTVGGVASNAVSFTILPGPNITLITDDASGATINSGQVGQRVQIHGGGFGSTQGSSTVTFNGTAATSDCWSAFTICVPVPTGATTGNLVVTVGGTASNSVSFTVLVAPNITQVNDSDGGAADTTGAVGQRLQIHGGGFGSTQGSSTVTFNGTVAVIEGWNANVIYTSVPAGATTGNLLVTVGGVPSNAVAYTVLTRPNIVQVTDNATGATVSSGAVGQRIDIHGGGFGSTQGTSTVTFNGTTATIDSWYASVVHVFIPDGATTGNLVVTVGGVVSNVVSFTVLARPNVTLITDNASGAWITSGQIGQRVNLIGGGFGATQGTSTVTFNGTTATILGWSPYAIYTSVPTGATTGNLVVTVGGVAGNAVAFTVLAPNITSLSSAFGAPGLAITISGSRFGASQSSSTVTFNGTAASVANWSDTQIIAAVPAGATSGNVLVTVSGTPSNGASFTVVAPPTISASVSPAPNASGWDNLIVTVAFTCTPGGLAIASCPSPQTVSTDGANQVVSGTVTDAVGDTATASVTVNIDRTQPTLTISSPADGSTVSSSTLAVTGSLSDNLSGLSGVTCDGTAASLVSGSFSCNVSLNTGTNLVIVRGTDIAGNVVAANFHITFTGALSTPNSLAVTPASINMLVSDTQQFTAIDDQGRARTDATWSVSDTSVATIDTNSSPTLTAITTGQVTLTANVGTTSASATINVLAGTSLSPGTTRWSTPTTSSLGVLGLVQARPIHGGPDLFVQDGTLLRAFTADGQQLWSSQPPNGILNFAPDANGGTFVINNSQNGGAWVQRLVDLDAQTGAAVWEYDAPGQWVANSNATALGGDGKIYFKTSGSSIVALDGNTGAPVSSYQAPDNIVYIDSGPNAGTVSVGPATMSNAMVGSDGNAYAVVITGSYHVQYQNGSQYYLLSSFEFVLSLLEMGPDGTTTLTTIHTNSSIVPGPDSVVVLGSIRAIVPGGSLPQLSAGHVIPDGRGGLLISWAGANDGSTTGPQFNITDVTGSTQSSFVLPSCACNVGFETMVLGDNNVLYVLAGNQQLGAFDLSSNGQTLWTYQASPGFGLSMSVSSAGGGLVGTLRNQNAEPYETETVIRFDSSGNATLDAWTGGGFLDYYIGDTWFGTTPTSNNVIVASAAQTVVLSSSPYFSPNQKLTDMAVQDIYVTGFSNDINGTNQTVISNVLQKIASSLPSYSSCNNWLVGAGRNTGLSGLGEIQGLLQSNLFGHATVWQGRSIVYQTWAFSYSTNPDRLPVLNLPSGVAMTVNDPGGFFNSNQPLFRPYNGAPFQLGPSHYPGNSLRAQALTLIHEVAHLITVDKFQPDLNDIIVSEANTATVYSKCRQLIEALR